MQMNHQHSGQDGSKGLDYMENSSDQELYEVNFKSNKLSSKQSSQTPKNNTEYDEVEEGNNDHCINIYKDRSQIGEEEEEEYEEAEGQYEQQPNQNSQEVEENDNYDDDDELDEVNGNNNNYQRQRYATQDQVEEQHETYPEYNKQGHDQQNIAEIVRDKIQQHNHQLEELTQEQYYSQQLKQSQQSQNNYINEVQDFQSQNIEVTQNKQHRKQEGGTNGKQQSNSQYTYQQYEEEEEPMRFERQLSKMTPEEAEIEYQNRCQMQLMQLQQKQISMKKNTDTSQQQSVVTSQQSSSRQTYKIQSDTHIHNDKKQSSQPQNNAQLASNSQKYSNKSIQQPIQRNRDGIENLQTMKTSLMISSQELHSNNIQQSQSNLQRSQQTNQQQQKQYYDYGAHNNSTKKKKQTPQQKQPNQLNHPNQDNTQRRPQSSTQPRKQESQTEKLSNLYYYGMQVQKDKTEQQKRIKQENEDRQMKKCTFKPELTQKAQALSLVNNNYLPIEDKTQIFMKRKQILIERRIEEKKRQETVGCTFTPKINANKYKAVAQDEQNMSVYDRQVEWQKKVHDKNVERMKHSYINIMTPSKQPQSRNSSATKRSNYDSTNYIQNFQKRLNKGNGYFSEKRISTTFLTYLNCKYDYNHQNSAKNQEVPQTLTAKPQEKDILISRQINFNQDNQNEKNRIQKALDICQTLGNGNQENSEQQFNNENHNNINDNTFGNNNHNASNYQSKHHYSQANIYKSNMNMQNISSNSNSKNSKSQILQYKRGTTAQIEKLKQVVNNAGQEQFQATSHFQKGVISKQLLKQYSYVNTLPKKVNFNSVSKLQNVVVQNNQYTLQDTQNYSDLQQFYSVKQQLGNHIYKQFQDKMQTQLKTIPQENSYQSEQVHSTNMNGLYEQAYKINKEIKELQEYA